MFWNPSDLLRRVGLALALAAIITAWWAYARPVPLPGKPVHGPVVQTETTARPFSFRGHRITPLADFEATAVVLSRERYRFDRAAEISPVDLALGWGPMSDARVVRQMTISQGGRWYHARWSGTPPIPVQTFIRHSANMHMIPATAAVKDALVRVRQGHVVSIRGRLVDVRGSDGWRWISSLSREDSGNGACEVIFVESIAIR